MRTTVIPAQITTVEDKIAGNLSLTQILILMLPIFFGTFVYVFIPPFMRLSIIKVCVVIILLSVCVILATRIKGKIIANWLSVLISYNLRPKFYVFNKNDLYLRDFVLPKDNSVKAKTVRKEIKTKTKTSTIKDLSTLEKYLKNPKNNISITPGKKGGFYVAYNKIKE